MNKLLTGYFVMLGIFALVGCLSPCSRGSSSNPSRAGLEIRTLPTIPLITDGPTKLECTPPELIAGVAVRLLRVVRDGETLGGNNALVSLFPHRRRVSHAGQRDRHHPARILLHIFWVFFTPSWSPSKSFDALIKLLLRESSARVGRLQHARTGDIVVPGIYVAPLEWTCSARRRRRRRVSRRPSVLPGGDLRYFAGLATIVVMNVFNAAQPALHRAGISAPPSSARSSRVE